MALGDITTGPDGLPEYHLERAPGTPKLSRGDFVSWGGGGAEALLQVSLEEEPEKVWRAGGFLGVVAEVLHGGQLVVKPLSSAGDKKLAQRDCVSRLCPECGAEIDLKSLRASMARSFAGMRVKDAAEMYGVSRVTIWKWGRLSPGRALKLMRKALERKRDESKGC